MLRRGASGARTRGVRHPFRQPRRAGRRIRPQRRGVPRTGRAGIRIRRGGDRDAPSAGGQPAAAGLPPPEGQCHHQPHRSGEPRAGSHHPPPATSARRRDRGLQHRQEHRRPPPRTLRRTTSNSSAASTSMRTISPSTSAATTPAAKARRTRANISFRYSTRCSTSGAGRTSSGRSCSKSRPTCRTR